MTSQILQFFRDISKPQPLTRNDNGNPLGGEQLKAINAEIDDLSRLVFITQRYLSPAQAIAAMAGVHDAAEKVVLARHKLTREFTESELAAAAQEKERLQRQEKMRAEVAKDVAAREAVRKLDSNTRTQILTWNAGNPSLRYGMPAWHQARNQFVAEVNLKRTQAGLIPLAA